METDEWVVRGLCLLSVRWMKVHCCPRLPLPCKVRDRTRFFISYFTASSYNQTFCDWMRLSAKSKIRSWVCLTQNPNNIDGQRAEKPVGLRAAEVMFLTITFAKSLLIDMWIIVWNKTVLVDVMYQHLEAPAPKFSAPANIRFGEFN